MKATIIILLTIPFFKCSFGQLDFVPETNANVKSLRLNYEIDSTFKLDKTYDFEFRLWTLAAMSSYKNVFILSKKGSLWKARFFETNLNQKGKISEILIHQDQLDSLWQRLLANQVLTLPT